MPASNASGSQDPRTKFKDKNLAQTVFSRTPTAQGQQPYVQLPGGRIIAQPRMNRAVSATITPFKLTTGVDNTDLTWKVSSSLSSVTDKLNGDALDLSSEGADWATGAIKFDVDTVLTVTSWILLKATISATLETSDWTLEAVTAEADALEIHDDGGSPPVQDEVKLLIGKVVIDTGVATAYQAVFAPQLLGYDALNGLFVRRFENAKINSSDLG